MVKKFEYKFKGHRLAHVVLVEKILGRSLPKEAQIHHVDGNGKNNAHTNLVVCPSQEYHHLLHRRQKALDECGNANWEKCTQCQQWDSPDNLRIYDYRDSRRRHIVHHVECWKKMEKSKRSA